MPTKQSGPKTKTAIQSPEQNRLLRSESDRVIAGVCTGIADYFGVDSSLIRILFITITLFGGGGIILYVLLWILIPSESAPAEKGHKIERPSRKAVHTWFGLCVALLGLYFLLANFGVIAWFPIGRLWPLILIIIGISMFWKQK